MPLDALPAKLIVPARQALHDKYCKWVLVRNSAADTRQGSQVDLDAYVWSDAGSLLLSNAVQVANGVTRATAQGPALDAWAARMGTARLPAFGAGGAVILVASSAGAQLYANDLLTYVPTGNRYQVLTSGIYQNGQQVPVGGVDTGPQTNLAAGSALTWQSQRPGVTTATVVVATQADGSGLSGGAGSESDDDLRARLDYIAANPPASGNDSEYQQTGLLTQGVALQQVFTYPAVLGPGTIAVAFTLRPGTPGANRIPSAALMSLVAQQLQGAMPASDSVYLCSIIASPVTVTLKTLWAQGASGWADGTTFPLYHAFSSVPGDRLVSASANAGGTLSPLAFRLSSASMTEVPQVGQNVGFYDSTNLVFRRKKILSVTTISSTSYDIAVDTTNGISDTSYTPYSGQPCCPWSDSLNSLVTPVVSYFDTLGPGEQFASFFDPGLRQRRSPPSPQFWPSSVTNRLLGGAAVPVPAQGTQQNQPPVSTLLTLTTLQDVVLAEPTPPYACPIGNPGVSSNMLTLQTLVAYPE